MNFSNKFLLNRKFILNSKDNFTYLYKVSAKGCSNKMQRCGVKSSNLSKLHRGNIVRSYNASDIKVSAFHKVSFKHFCNKANDSIKKNDNIESAAEKAENREGEERENEEQEEEDVTSNKSCKIRKL